MALRCCRPIIALFAVSAAPGRATPDRDDASFQTQSHHYARERQPRSLQDGAQTLAAELQGLPHDTERIDLQSLRLRGSIPASLGNFRQLRYLRIRENLLTGPIPRELGQLDQLRTLDLGQNMLTGPIPSELTNLSQLSYLDLGYNRLSGPIPELDNFTQLHTIRLFQNKLSGIIPRGITQLSRLEVISLYRNRLSGTIPPDVGNLVRLHTIRLFENQLTGTVPRSIGQLFRLRVLSLYRNKLAGRLPAEVGRLPELQVLALHGNFLTGPIPPELGNLSHLQTLQLALNRLTGSVPPELGSCADLRELAADRNHLSGLIPRQLGNLSSLTSLSLHSNNLTGTIPVELMQLSDLKTLRLENNSLTGTIPNQMSHLTKLRDLRLGPNQLRGELPDTSQCFQLATITVRRCMLTGIGGGVAASVQTLDLSLNLLTEVPRAVQGLRMLRSLNLEGNVISTWPQDGVVPDEYHSADGRLCGFFPRGHLDWPSLVSLRVSGNPLAGVRARDFLYSLAHLPSLATLTATSCGLWGEITSDGWLTSFLDTGACPEPARPSAVPSFQSLRHLDLADNNVSGLSAGPVASLLVGRFPGNRLRHIPIHDWIAPSFTKKLSALALERNSDLRIEVDPPQRCPNFLGTRLVADLHGFGAVDGTLYECTRVCRAKVWLNLDPTVHANLCRCQDGTEGSGRDCRACPADTYSKSSDPARSLRECVPCPADSSTRGRESASSIAECVCQQGFRKTVHPTGHTFVCKACPVGSTLDTATDLCVTDPLFVVMTACFSLAFLCVGLVVPMIVALPVPIIDVSKEGDVMMVTVNSDHHVLPWLGWPVMVAFRGTGSRELDAKPHTALVSSSRHLCLPALTLRGTDTSCGSVRICFPVSLIVSGVAGIPALLILAFFTSGAAFSGSFLHALGVARAGFAFGGLLLGFAIQAFRRFHAFRTPLARRHRLFLQRLRVANPAPKHVPRGPGRGISLRQLVDFRDFFQAFVGQRSMYYVAANLIVPLTRPSKLSFAELAGPGQLNWFVSHYWGSVYQDFVSAIRKHAESLSSGYDPETRYWICSFSNNQHVVHEELGGKVQDSSFYLALRSPHCEGTAMVLDEDCHALTRSWCIFEVLQTLELSTESQRFRGLQLCTSSGIINQGTSSTDAVMAVAHRLVDFNCENAVASSEADKVAIDQAIQDHHGGFKSVNAFVQRHVLASIVSMQQLTFDRFREMTAMFEERIQDCEAVTRSAAMADRCQAGARWQLRCPCPMSRSGPPASMEGIVCSGVAGPTAYQL